MAEAVNPAAAAAKPSPDPSRPRLDPHDSKALALLAAEACDDRKAANIVLIRVEEISSIADWFVIASGRSDTQVRAIAEAVETAGRARGRRPLWVEGLSHGQWVLLDYGDIVVHVFFGPVREFYDLERLWSKAPRRPAHRAPPPAHRARPRPGTGRE